MTSDAIKKMLRKHGDPNKVKGFYDQSWIKQIIGDMSKNQYEMLIDKAVLENNADIAREHNAEVKAEKTIKKSADENGKISVSERSYKRSLDPNMVKLSINHRNARLVKSVLMVLVGYKVVEMSIIKHAGMIKLVRCALYTESFGLKSFLHFKPFPVTYPDIETANKRLNKFIKNKRKTGIIEMVEDWDARHLLRNAPIDPKYLGIK